MKLFAGGVRGTRVVADGAFAGFGGDTTCFLVSGAEGEQAIVDAGSGLRSVAAKLSCASAAALPLYMTHYHLDHVAGLPSFPPLYETERIVEIAGPRCAGIEPEEVLARIFGPPIWPVALNALTAHVRVTALAEEPSTRVVGGMEIRWCPVPHPGGCFSYRFDETATGQSLVIATDLEWALASPGQREAFLEFCRTPCPAELLLLDGQFTPENYDPFRGWGHSRWSDCVEIARLVGAGRLAVIHHDPCGPDTRLEKIEAQIRALYPSASLLRQGTEIALTGRGTAAR